jgi:hypothetical protein
LNKHNGQFLTIGLIVFSVGTTISLMVNLQLPWFYGLVLLPLVFVILVKAAMVVMAIDWQNAIKKTLQSRSFTSSRPKVIFGRVSLTRVAPRQFKSVPLIGTTVRNGYIRPIAPETNPPELPWRLTQQPCAGLDKTADEERWWSTLDPRGSA